MWNGNVTVLILPYLFISDVYMISLFLMGLGHYKSYKMGKLLVENASFCV